MLHHECGLLGVENEALDDFGCHYTLFRVEIRAGLVDKIDVRRLRGMGWEGRGERREERRGGEKKGGRGEKKGQDSRLK